MLLLFMDSLFQINQFDLILFRWGISGDYRVLTGRSAYEGKNVRLWSGPVGKLF